MNKLQRHGGHGPLAPQHSLLKVGIRTSDKLVIFAQKAQESYERALQIDPDSTDIMEDYSHMLLCSMQIVEAIKEVDRMMALDPFVPVHFLEIHLP